MKPNLFTSKRQDGAALFVALMFLIILTLIGLSAANVGILQERMAGNVRETNVAFQDAEATLREIEQRLVQISEGGSGGLPATIPIWSDAINDLGVARFDCTFSGLEPDDIPWETAPTTGNDYYLVELTDTVNLNGLIFGSACRPMHEVGLTGSSRFFMIMVRAVGPAGVGERILQSIFYYPA